MNRYVLAFMFSPDLRQVALIRKLKPEWQAGKLNGIGGKIEADESHYDACVREFREEAGLHTSKDSWNRFLELGGRGHGELFTVDCFCGKGDLNQLVSVEKERVEITSVPDVATERWAMVENLPWIVTLAIDFMRDGRPRFTTVLY